MIQKSFLCNDEHYMEVVLVPNFHLPARSSSFFLALSPKVYGEVAPYLCGECDRPFKRKNNLYMHSFTYAKEKPFQCPKCDKSYATPPLLKQHDRKSHYDHGEIFKCPICDKKFAHKQLLRSHSKVHARD